MLVAQQERARRTSIFALISFSRLNCLIFNSLRLAGSVIDEADRPYSALSSSEMILYNSK